MCPPPPAAPPAPSLQGISPVTRDFVNPEKAWPHLQRLAAATAATGRALLPRLPVYPPYLREQQLLPARLPALRRTAGQHGQQPGGQQQQVEAGPPRVWLDTAGGRDSPAAATLRLADAEGLARGSSWFAGAAEEAGEGDAAGADGPVPAGSSDGDHGATAQGMAGRGQQNTAPGPDVQQQGQGQPGAARQLKSSVPAVRRRSAARTWRVAVAEDGLLEGCPGPEVVSQEVGPSAGSLQTLRRACGAEPLAVLGQALPPMCCAPCHPSRCLWPLLQRPLASLLAAALCCLPALQVERLLHGVLEEGHELSEEEMAVLFSGKSAEQPRQAPRLGLSAEPAGQHFQ